MSKARCAVRALRGAVLFMLVQVLWLAPIAQTQEATDRFADEARTAEEGTAPPASRPQEAGPTGAEPFAPRASQRRETGDPNATVRRVIRILSILDDDIVSEQSASPSRPTEPPRRPPDRPIDRRPPEPPGQPPDRPPV